MPPLFKPEPDDEMTVKPILRHDGYIIGFDVVFKRQGKLIRRDVINLKQKPVNPHIDFLEKFIKELEAFRYSKRPVVYNRPGKIKEDDVLNFHNYLKKFDGDFEKIIK